ncbi:MAG TPA: carboxypeptidase regulatory-like domain-containing protein [Pyrinomonadaceae bacterium]
MKKNISLLILLIAILFLPQLSRGAELITNGGFETGTFTGWTAIDVTTNVWYNWRVTTATCGACLDIWTNGGSSPHTGTRSAWNGWAAGNPVPDAYRLRQTITIPNNPNELVKLKWFDRLQWNLAFQSGSVLPQFVIVNVLNPSTNAVLRELYRFTAPAASQGPTTPPGVPWNQHVASLTAYKGQTIKLEFECTVAQNAMGPGICEFDDISVQNLVPTSAAVPIGGRIVTAKDTGIGNVIVNLTDSHGVVRTARTNPFGYYRFDDVSVGDTYIISVSSKSYTFSQSSQVLNVTQETSEVNFNADN